MQRLDYTGFKMFVTFDFRKLSAQGFVRGKSVKLTNQEYLVLYF